VWGHQFPKKSSVNHLISSDICFRMIQEATITIVLPYLAKCEKCDHEEWRNSLVSYNTSQPFPDVQLDYPDGCPKCDDPDFDKT